VLRRKGVGEGGRNDPNIVCTYELKKKTCDGTTTTEKKKNMFPSRVEII
jgi:hypothetical protein